MWAGGERPLRTMATRPARACIEFGLARTRTVHFETCTVEPGSQSDQNDPREKVPITLFCAPRGGPFRPRTRSLVTLSHWFPMGIGTESTQNRSVAYRAVEIELSNSSALERSPGGMSQNHMTDFLKTVPTRNLTGFTRKKRSMHEVRRHPPSAIASTYVSQQSMVSILRC